MRNQKTCLILALFITVANIARGADPSPAPAATTTRPVITTTPAPGTETEGERLRQRRLLLGLIVALLAVAAVYLLSRRQKQAIKPGR